MSTLGSAPRTVVHRAPPAPPPAPTSPLQSSQFCLPPSPEDQLISELLVQSAHGSGMCPHVRLSFSSIQTPEVWVVSF